MNLAEEMMVGAVGTVSRPVILIADDIPLNIIALQMLLEDEYEICTAVNGEEALAVGHARLPDLILLDVMMPDLDGYEVCRRLKSDERTKNIPIIFVTAHNDPVEEASAIDNGAADFISKPFHDKVVRARVRRQVTLKLQADKLQSLALIDGLTGIGNRRQFDAMLAREWASCSRTETPLAVIMIDIDSFKRYNDHYGHQAGDRCIQAIASALAGQLKRPHDTIARYGGEELACILPDTYIDGAILIAHKLEQCVRDLAIPHAGSTNADVVTISLGVAVMIPRHGIDDSGSLVVAADQQLYKAKHAGRGTTCSVMIGMRLGGKGGDLLSRSPPEQTVARAVERPPQYDGPIQT